MMNEEQLFHLALEKPASERAAFLKQNCGGDVALRRRVEALLQAHENPGSFLEKPAVNPGTTGDLPPGQPDDEGGSERSDNEAPGPSPIAEGPGTRIGPYKLLQPIGEGGMGAVFMAEQTHPVRRKVALKVIKPGMDSRQVIARFEAERQALALMDHPSIAKVFDAGTTDSGRPYFVMELVKGVPITKYCDERRLTPRERLELFVPVCLAVQHAHHKGVIHRDLKPSNVLIALYDGKPVPKVIDFGVAKATGPKLTERTLFTEFGSVLGTLEYMSPEQAELNQLDVDTRSDIYSLGVLLYELLTGTTPLERKRLEGSALLDVLRIIREEEPPRPSNRLSATAELPAIAADRGTEPKKLRGLLRAELDWIVMRALEKDRDRRYETAADLARDVNRYLNDEPVRACPPGASYRLRKLVRRHRGPVLTAGLVALTLVVGIVGTSWGLVAATRAKATAQREAKEKEKARRQAVTECDRAGKAESDAKWERDRAREAEADTRAFSDFLVKDVLAAARPRGVQGGLGVAATVAQALEEAEGRIGEVFAGRPKAEATARHGIGVTWRNLGRYAKAVEHLRRASALRERELGATAEETLDSRNSLALAMEYAGQFDEALALHQENLKRLTATRGPDHQDTLTTQHNLARAYRATGQLERAVTLFEQTLDRRRATLGPDHIETLISMNTLGDAYTVAGRLDKALPLLEETLERRRARLGPEHPYTLSTLHNLANVRRDAGRLEMAVSLYEQALAGRRSQLGADHPDSLATLTNLASVLRSLGQTEKSLSMLEQAVRGYLAAFGPDHPDTLIARFNLAKTYQASGQMDKAIATFEQVLEKLRASRGPGHPRTLTCQMSLAVAYGERREFNKEAALLCDLLSRRREQDGPTAPATAEVLAALGANALKRQAYDEAEPFLRQCLGIREEKQPEDWSTSSTRSLLGGALLGQKEYAEAEPLLVQGYEGLKQRAAKIPGMSRTHCLTEALERLMHLYTAWGKPKEAARWQEELRALESPAWPFEGEKQP
jgi:serine/threonine protein kinase/tetratricopeptide (TPR) repeat protein